MNWIDEKIKNYCIYTTKCRYETRKLIRKGLIKKLDQCQWCNSKINIEVHHPDYSRPDWVIFLCRKCHIDHEYNGLKGPNNGYWKYNPAYNPKYFQDDRNKLSNIFPDLYNDIMREIKQITPT